MTRTYTVLEVPAVVYAAVRALLARAGDAHAFQPDGAIDMHGIALQEKTGATKSGEVVIGTILRSQNGHGRIEICVGAEVLQVDVADARKLAASLNDAIEAAISDQLIFKFLTERCGVPAQKAAAGLLDFRKLRQGSRDAVNPS